MFSFFQAPVFVTFTAGRFWRRMTAWGGFWGLLTGIVAAGVWVAAIVWAEMFRSLFQQAMWMGIVAALADLVVSVVVSLATEPKRDRELVGLVKCLEATVDEAPAPWFRRPVPLGAGALVLAGQMYVPFLAVRA